MNDKEKKTIGKIYENYENIEKSLVSQLSLETPNHYLTQGTYREAVWKELFESIIPKKFCIDQGVFIIDSLGNISSEVDLAIFDEQYTPYIFNYGKIKFIPIEAVAVVVQCKSDNFNDTEVKDWADNINKLTTSLNSVVRIMSGGIVYNSVDIENNKVKKSQTSTRPIRIFCTTSNGKTKDGKTKTKVSEKILKQFDICLSVDETSTQLRKQILKEDKFTYEDWYRELNHFDLDRFEDKKQKYEDIVCKSKNDCKKTLSDIKVIDKDGKENVVLSLIFQLNQLLMIINNPMLFPHESYAKLFKKIVQ